MNKGEPMTPPPEPQGLKARIEKLMTDQPGKDFSIHDIGTALGLPKTDHSAITPTIIKLRNAGRVREVTQGPAHSAKGRRYTKRYRIVIKTPAPAPIVVREMDDRRALAFTR